MRKILKFKWTVSKARNTYMYNVCSLFVDGKKAAACNGGGYDMKGTSLGNYIAKAFKKELLKLKETFYGLSFHDPDYDPGKAKVKGETVEDREKSGKSFGLDRYQAFYSASSKTPTKNHIIPLINGACGFSSIEKIINAVGYKIECVDDSKNSSIYILEEGENDKN